MRILALITALGAMPGGSALAETCDTFGAGQYYDAIHFCVSSVLVDKADRRYGPENLNRDGAAWCEGVKGSGIGQSVTIRIDRGSPFKRLWVANGYGKTAKSFRENGRVARLKITTDTGLSTTVRLIDQAGEQPFNLPREAAFRWVKLSIDKVYPGSLYEDTCISAVSPDFEFTDNAPSTRGN